MPNAPLEREEYIEQAYFFRVYRERLIQNIVSQEILEGINEEVLSTTKLPLAIEFLKGEILMHGRLGEGMAKLPHYFAAFQSFVMTKAEEERSRFDLKVGLEILEREATYRANNATPSGLFVYQFECLSRNKLGYDRGMVAMAEDPLYDEAWSEWIRRCRLQLGSIDFADLIYLSSEQCLIDQRKQTFNPELESKQSLLFGAKEGRIARANRGKDPLFMFAALQRQLGYPIVPRIERLEVDGKLSPIALEARITQLERRVSLMDAELQGNLDLSQYYNKAQQGSADPASRPFENPGA